MIINVEIGSAHKRGEAKKFKIVEKHNQEMSTN